MDIDIIGEQKYEKKPHSRIPLCELKEIQTQNIL